MQDIQNNCIILAPASLHPLIQQELLMKKKGYTGISLQTMESFLLSHTTLPQQFDDVLFQYRQIMNPLRERLTVYKDICCEDYFLQQCMSFIEDIKFYDIDIHSLPNSTQEENELVYIIKAFYPIRLKADFLYQTLHTSLVNEKKVYIYPAFLSFKQVQMQQKLLKEGAQLLDTQTIEPTVQFYHAINMREEIEGLAQYIIQHNLKGEDCAITLCNTQYKYLVHQIFHRYQIPFTILSQNTSNLSAKLFSVLLKYYLHPTKQHFYALLDAPLFPMLNIVDLKQYVTLFQKDLRDDFIEVPQVHSNLLSSYEIEKLHSLRDQAVITQSQLQELLIPIFDATWEEALCILCDIVKAAIDPMKERKNFMQLQSYLQNVYPFLHHKDDLSFLLTRIEKLSASHTNKELQGVIVENLTTLLPKRPYHFIVGTTQADYPSFPIKKGIFDETYVSKIAYPTMQERYDVHLQQVEKQLHQTKHLWISYPLGNYEGKGKEAALEIETFVHKKAMTLPVQYTMKSYQLQTNISLQQAHALYLKDQILHGSISSLEMYIKCPFSYFLKYGLHIKEPYQPNFDESKAGTLSHHVLEVLTQTYGKQYVSVQRDKIKEILQEEFQSILSIYPHQKDWAMLFQQRLLLNISQNLKVLQDMEEHSEMSIFKSEYEFYRKYEIENVTLQLHGFIDRIDQKNEYLRIIDYKSSPKTLVEQDVFAALQLQLCTYGIVAQDDFQKKLLGVYYVSLKNENITYTAGKMKRRPVEYVPLQKTDYEDCMVSTHRLQGWNMDEQLEVLDDNGKHIVGVSMNKNGEVKARKVYDSIVLHQHFESMYQSIGKRILSGDISLTPDEFACTYCPYHEICRFKGFPYKKAPLVEIDERIYKQ